MSLYSLPRPSGFRQLPSSLLVLDSRSNTLIVPGKYEMPLPTTDAEAVALGWPSIATAVDGDMWLCDEAAGNLVGKVRGYQLAPQNAPLQNRDFHGLPYGGNLWAKKAMEIVNGVRDLFQSAVAADCDVALEDFTISVLLRTLPARPAVGGWGNMLICKRQAAGWAQGWQVYFTAANVGFGLFDAVGGGANITTPFAAYDGALHLVTLAVDRNGNISFYIDDQATVAVVCPAAASISTAEGVSLGGNTWSDTWLGGQVAWAWANIGVAASRVGHDALWAALNSDWLDTDNTYVRANPLTYRISQTLGHVATAAANAFMPAYAANASAGDNALKTGVVCEDGASFLGLGTDNMPAWVGTNAVVTAADGPSGMRDAIRVADTDGVNAGYATSGSANLVGATNVPFIFSAYVKSGGVGTWAVYQSYYTGDGGGPELITNWTIAGAISAVWRPFIGGSLAPVGAAHTAVVTYLIPTDNVGASLGTVDFAEVWGVQNSAVDRLAWRRCAAGAASATATPALSYSNVGNARYNPARGRMRIRISDYSGSAGNCWLVDCGGYTAAGNLSLLVTGGRLTLVIWNATPAIAVNLDCGALPTAAEHTYNIQWNAAIGTASVMEGAVVLGSVVVAPWAPPVADVAPLAIGAAVAGTNAALCHITLLEGFDF